MIHITPEALGPFTTDADAHKMVELLRQRGYDARFGAGRDSEEEEEEFDQEQYDRDWLECLQLLV